MDVHALKSYIKVNEELIEEVLDKAGFYYISDNFSGGLEYRCAITEDGNATKVSVNKETLKSSVYGKNVSGDLITLVSYKMNLSFPKTLEFISKVVKFEEVNKKDYELPFGGFYKKIQRFRDNDYAELQSYNESILDEYSSTPNLMFYKDGISLETQMKFNVGYDAITDRITVPWRSLSGELIGVMGRLNKYEIDEFEQKWLPTLRFKKSQTLFGYSDNYRNIQDKSVCHIFESEKSPMILDSMGSHVGLGLGGSNLSEYQANNIKSLFTDKIIVAMDEGLDEDVSRSIAEKLKMDRFFKNEVYYVQDKNNLWLPKDSKMSPVDIGQDYKSLLKQCLIKV